MTAIPELFTVDELSTDICEAYGSVSQTDRDRAYRAINRALRVISRKGRWPFFRVEDDSFVTISGTETYKLKDNFSRPDFLHMRSPARKLKYLDLRTLRRAYPNNTTLSGIPLFWRVVNFDKNSRSYQIALWPIPNGIYTIYIDADTLPPFVSDKNDDIRDTGLPEEMIATLIDIAIALMYEKSQDALYQVKYAQAMAQLDEDYYRFGQLLDDDLQSRQYSGAYDSRRDDPILPPQYD